MLSGKNLLASPCKCGSVNARKEHLTEGQGNPHPSPSLCRTLRRHRQAGRMEHLSKNLRIPFSASQGNPVNTPHSLVSHLHPDTSDTILLCLVVKQLGLQQSTAITKNYQKEYKNTRNLIFLKYLQ